MFLPERRNYDRYAKAMLKRDAKIAQNKSHTKHRGAHAINVPEVMTLVPADMLPLIAGITSLRINRGVMPAWVTAELLLWAKLYSGAPDTALDAVIRAYRAMGDAQLSIYRTTTDAELHAPAILKDFELRRIRLDALERAAEKGYDHMPLDWRIEK